MTSPDSNTSCARTASARGMRAYIGTLIVPSCSMRIKAWVARAQFGPVVERVHGEITERRASNRFFLHRGAYVAGRRTLESPVRHQHAEAVEAIDPQPVEGIRATGAIALEEIVYGVIPQVMPLWISYTLYRFESNVRAAAVVGMVGAGGIGVILWEIIRGFYYAETCAVMIIIAVSVTLIDLASARIRQTLI